MLLRVELKYNVRCSAFLVAAVRLFDEWAEPVCVSTCAKSSLRNVVSNDLLKEGGPLKNHCMQSGYNCSRIESLPFLHEMSRQVSRLEMELK